MPDKIFTFTVPAADAARLLAAYGSPQACFAEIRKVLEDRVQQHEKAAAEAAVVIPERPSFDGFNGDISDAQ